MPAYLIVTREGPITDEQAMAEYKQKTRAKQPDVKPKPLVVYGAMEALEGQAPEATIMLEFEDMEKAKAWYHSPEYQEALPYRLKAANFKAFIVEGLAKPL